MTKSPSRGRDESGAGAAPVLPTARQHAAEIAQAEMSVRKCIRVFLKLLLRVNELPINTATACAQQVQKSSAHRFWRGHRVWVLGRISRRPHCGAHPAWIHAIDAKIL